MALVDVEAQSLNQHSRPVDNCRLIQVQAPRGSSYALLTISQMLHGSHLMTWLSSAEQVKTRMRSNSDREASRR